jgi:putative acetyltransferase
LTSRIRPESAPDIPAIREVVRAAFPQDAEMRLVDRLRASGDIANSLVCEADGFIVGHALLSRMNARADGRPVAAAALAPVSVLPECQREGIGTRLIERIIEDARASGFAMLFVVGDPDYYSRFGFSTEAAARYRSPYRGPQFMGLPLAPNLPTPYEADAAYPAAFDQLENS